MPKITLSERERELIALLAEGHTDVVAAQRLGISPRSVTNILRSLMDRLGVENRFQLGLALGFLRRTHAAKPPSVRAVAEQTNGGAVAGRNTRRGVAEPAAGGAAASTETRP